jgi:hypothetical protein
LALVRENFSLSYHFKKFVRRSSVSENLLGAGPGGGNPRQTGLGDTLENEKSELFGTSEGNNVKSCREDSEEKPTRNIISECDLYCNEYDFINNWVQNNNPLSIFFP